jgi:uncharacterized protein (TIGR02996 family)
MVTESTSSSDEALLADVVAEPDDDRPRLVYADYLQQRGDPRGELIAVQCALEVARAADEDAKAAKLASAARKLLDAHELVWVAPARSILPRAMKFRRGFIEHAALDHPDELVKARPALRRHAPLLRAVDLQRGLAAIGDPALAAIDEVVAHNVIELGDVHALALAAGRSRLRQLTAAGTGLTDATLVALVELPLALAKLEFSLERRPTRRMPILERLAAAPARQHLRTLRIRNPASLDDVAAILPALPALETLVVTNGSPTAATIRALAEAAPQLVDLELESREGHDPKGVDLRSLVSAMPKLRSLRIENLGVTDAQATLLASSRALEQLVRLDLTDNQLGRGAVAICESRRANGLRRLKLSGNPLSDADKQAIRASPLAASRRVAVR